MVDEAEVMWRLYAENTAHGRHHETMRATVTNIVLIIAGAALTVIGFSKGIQFNHWPLTVFLIFVGLFGAIFVIKHYERYCMHMERARQYRTSLETWLPKTNILLLKSTADTNHKKEFRRLVDWKLSKFWVALHLIVACFGVALTVMALTSKSNHATLEGSAAIVALESQLRSWCTLLVGSDRGICLNSRDFAFRIG